MTTETEPKMVTAAQHDESVRKAYADALSMLDFYFARTPEAECPCHEDDRPLFVIGDGTWVVDRGRFDVIVFDENDPGREHTFDVVHAEAVQYGLARIRGQLQAMIAAFTPDTAEAGGDEG